MATPKRKALGNAVDKLAELGFDPIEAMVVQYKKLLAEIERQEGISLGTVVVLRQDGKPKAYDVGHHMNVIRAAADLGKELLRYGYGRVLEDKDVEKAKAPPSLNIMLTDGTTSVINEQEPDDTDLTTSDAE